MDELTIRRIGPAGTDQLVAASHLFDNGVTVRSAKEFLTQTGHHAFIGYLGDQPVGFVTGVEMVHPDKSREMFLYELGVDERFRRRGYGSRLVETLREFASALGCRGMWVLADNEIAEKTYVKAGSDPAEAARMMEWRSL